jgi:hypothetical protein
MAEPYPDDEWGDHDERDERCTYYGGDIWVECDDPIQCTYPRCDGEFHPDPHGRALRCSPSQSCCRSPMTRRCPMEPDLTAELDAAEDIVTGRAETVATEVWWGVRYTAGSGEHITSYASDDEARKEIIRSNRLNRDTRHALLRREITTITTPWEEVSG